MQTNPQPTVKVIQNDVRECVENADVDIHAFTFWALRAQPVKYEVLKAAWLAEGFEEKDLPKPVSPGSALTRALETIAGRLNGEEGRVRVTADYDRKSKTHVVTLSKWVEDTDDGMVQNRVHDSSQRVAVTKEGELKFIGDGWVDKRWLQTIIIRRFAISIGELNPTKDLSKWFVGIAERLCGAQRIRPDGGLYMVLAQHRPTWQSIMKIAEDVFGFTVIYEIDAIGADATIKTAMAAIDHEVATITGEIKARLNGEAWKGRKTRKIRPDGATKQLRIVRDLKARVEAFSEVLGARSVDVDDALITAEYALAKLETAA